MKKTVSLLLLLFLGIGFATSQSPKREMRATWAATVYRLDWPASAISSTGNTTQINSQKNLMIRLLDSLSTANMNAIFFQVRSRCDAMYNSSYEPWSSDLVSTRGMNPGYDPLAFVVEEAHKRGIEVHTWINPYRFESVKGAWAGLPGDYKATHPDWVLSYSSSTILDPGRPEVRKRIKDIIGEIVNNYDIDGVVFDDYFYRSGTGSLDAATQALYKPSSMSVDDWRRKNVNDMVAAVYDTIQKVKPYVTFGIGPFGIWTTQSRVATSYGLTLPPGITGQDAYQALYCDAVAWLQAGTVDYISPQLYWSTYKNGQQYGVLCPWWANVADKYGKHFYTSQTLDSIVNRGISRISETELQIDINRSSTKNGAPGSVFYSAKPFYNIAAFPGLLRNGSFSQKALVPAIDWKTHPTYGAVTGLKLTGNQLTWDLIPGVRYTIYAIPPSQVGTVGVFSTSTYLLGVSYTNSYTLNSTIASGDYCYGVAVYDRYGNEFTHAVLFSTPTGLPFVNGDAFNCFAYHANDGVYLKMRSESQNTLNVSLISVQGSKQYHLLTNETLSAGEHTVPLPAGLPKGIYLIQVNSSLGNKVIKIAI